MNPSHHDNEEEQKDHHRAYEPEFLSHQRKNKVRMGRRKKEELLLSLAQSHSKKTARAKGKKD